MSDLPTVNKYIVGQEVVLGYDESKTYLVYDKKHACGWHYKLVNSKTSKKFGRWVSELEIASANPKPVKDAVKPDHYKADDTTDLIAMWCNIMTDEEFRKTMFSHISKYLFRYSSKNGEEDFKKALEYMRRLQKFEDEKGHYKKETN